MQLANASPPILSIPSCTSTSSIPVFEKALSEIVLKFPNKIIFPICLLQPLKADIPILSNFGGRYTSPVQLVQLAKALSPIFFTVSGIFIVSTFQHPLNASAYISSIPSSNSTSFRLSFEYHGSEMFEWYQSSSVSGTNTSPVPFVKTIFSASTSTNVALVVDPLFT